MIVVCATACGSGLEREAGRVDVSVQNIPSQADRIRLELSGEDIDTYRVALNVGGASLVHAIDSVPASEVSVSAVATENGLVISRSERNVTIVANATNEVELVLGSDSPAVGPVLSGPLLFSMSETFQPGTSPFTVTTGLTGTSWNSFLVTASSELGRQAQTFELRAARMRLLGSETLDEFWDGPVELQIVARDGQRSVAIATAATVEDSSEVTMALGAGAFDLNELTADILEGGASLRLTGRAAVEETEPAPVQINATLEWAAF